MVKARTDQRLRVTPQMVELFERGLELVAEGCADIDARGEKAEEFRRIDKELCWRLLRLPLHACSVFDPDLDGPPTAHLRPEHGMYIDWSLAQAWRRALKAALDARRTR
jgi:hypothetical protein